MTVSKNLDEILKVLFYSPSDKKPKWEETLAGHCFLRLSRTQRNWLEGLVVTEAVTGAFEDFKAELRVAMELVDNKQVKLGDTGYLFWMTEDTYLLECDDGVWPCECSPYRNSAALGPKIPHFCRHSLAVLITEQSKKARKLRTAA